jgi:hypothetical protein
MTSNIEHAIEFVAIEISDVRQWGISQKRDIVFKENLLQGISKLLETYANEYERYYQ